MLRAIAADASTPCNDTFESHPCKAERLARVHVLAAGLPASGELGTQRFREAIAGVVTGSNPLRAARVGSALVFAYAGLALDAPASELNVEAGHAEDRYEEHHVMVFPISIDLAQGLQAHAVAGSAVYIGSRGGLWVVTDRARAAVASELVHRVRPVRPAELAALKPDRIAR
jgi:predicted Zn-dependent protease